MISLIIFIASIAIAIGYAVKNMIKEKSEQGYVRRIFKIGFLWMPILIIVFGIIISIIQPFALSRVDAGHVGIKVNLTGNDRGVSDYSYKTGWVFYNTWTESLYEFPTYQQHIEYDEQTIITKGGFAATIKPSFNYSIIPETVGDMFSNLRLDMKQVEQGWLKTAIVGSVNDVANRWVIDDIFNKREEFESAIVVECNKRVSKWFVVSQLRTNIVPPESLQAAIESKTNSIQQAQAEDQKAKTAEAEARKKIAIAKGDSAQLVISASGQAEASLISARAEAEAMKIKQREITSLYVEYLKVSKWNGQNPSTVLGNNPSTIISVK